ADPTSTASASAVVGPGSRGSPAAQAITTAARAVSRPVVDDKIRLRRRSSASVPTAAPTKQPNTQESPPQLVEIAMAVTASPTARTMPRAMSATIAPRLNSRTLTAPGYEIHVPPRTGRKYDLAGREPHVRPVSHPGHVDQARAMSEQASIVTPSTTPSGRARIKALDVIRGFALIGILPANVQPIAASAGAVLRAGPGTESPWWGILVYQRFYVIFALLFGVGFSLLLRSATDRVSRPRFVLLRRLLVLLGFGLAHHLLWPGDILAVYALVGLFVLLPSTW